MAKTICTRCARRTEKKVIARTKHEMGQVGVTETHKLMVNDSTIDLSIMNINVNHPIVEVKFQIPTPCVCFRFKKLELQDTLLKLLHFE